jgi:asparagine synthetase B (glutamine-hydrolysing)
MKRNHLMLIISPLKWLKRTSFIIRFFVSEQGSPDLKAAKEVAEYLGTFHHEFHFTVQVFAWTPISVCEF